MEYEFIPIVYPNKPDDTRIPSPLPTAFPTITSEVVPGQGLPFITSDPYVAPEPVAEPTPLPITGVLVDSAATLVYHPLTDLPATTTTTTTNNYSLPTLITTMGGDQSLYAPYTGATGASGKDWSLYPAIHAVDISGYDMSQMGNVEFAPGKTITRVQEIAISDGGFGSLTLNSDGIQNAGVITGIDSLQLNTQILTALPNALLLNGVPVATTSDLPNINQWANYPAIDTIQMNAPGSGGPHQMTGVANIQWSQGTTLIGEKNPTSPANPSGSNARFFVLDYPLDPTPKIIYSSDLSGSYSATGTYTGVPKWATFAPSQNVDWAQKEITNINKITFNTAVPGLGGASVNALNELNFSYATALVNGAGINNLNNIAWWNPDYPGVPGFYINLYTKKLSYAGGAASAYLATDTKLCVPSLYTSAVPGTAGGKLEVLGADANTATINGNPCSASWSEYPCTAVSVDMAGHQILNCRQIDFKNDNLPAQFNLLSIDNEGYLTYSYPPGNVIRITPPNGWSAFPALQNVNAAGFNINNLGQLQFNFDPANILSVAGGTTLQWRGQNIAIGAVGNVADWAQYVANADVYIPAQHALNINQENANFYYKDCHLNANIYHGVFGGHGVPPFVSSSPDFISYPTTFQVGGTGSPAREFSVTAGFEGLGLNSLTEINIDSVAICVINSGFLVEIGGAAVTINTVGAILMESADLTATIIGAAEINAGGAVEIGAGAAISIAAAGAVSLVAGADLNFTSDGATWNVGGLVFDALGVDINWGGTRITTGETSWGSLTNISITAATLNLTGGVNLNILGAITSITSGTLLINNPTATEIASPVLSLNSAQTILNAGSIFKTDIVQPTTADNLAISGVKTITGGGSGMNLTNIANFETYSATNVLLPCKSFSTTLPQTILNSISPIVVYTSTSKVWSWLNIPQLLMSFSVEGFATNSGTFTAGQPASFSVIVYLLNITQPANIVRLRDMYLLSTTRQGGSGTSGFSGTMNYNFPNDGSKFAQGDSYQIQIQFYNNQASPATNVITILDQAYFSFNVINAGAL